MLKSMNDFITWFDGLVWGLPLIILILATGIYLTVRLNLLQCRHLGKALKYMLKNDIPGQAKEKPQQAEVIAVGPGGMVDGKEVAMAVKVGQIVIYSKYAGTEVKLGKEEYTVVRQSDILAVVEED